jgi:universal stress protein A
MTMIPPRKILCPTDFSEPSYQGIAAAVEMATQFSAELNLIHVVSALQPVSLGEGAPVFDYSAYLNDMMASAEKEIARVVESRIPKGLTVTTTVVEGYPADQIVGFSEKNRIDMIVMSTHGLTGWRRFIFGSVAEKVVRLSKCPVLTIPAPEGHV